MTFPFKHSLQRSYSPASGVPLPIAPPQNVVREQPGKKERHTFWPRDSSLTQLYPSIKATIHSWANPFLPASSFVSAPCVFKYVHFINMWTPTSLKADLEVASSLPRLSHLTQGQRYCSGLSVTALLDATNR